MRAGLAIIGVVMLWGCQSMLDLETPEQKNQKVEVYTQLGLGYMNQGRLASSLEALEDALRVDPLSSPANYAMALLKIRLGESKDARYHFDRALLTITDANVTTFFVAIILLSIGSGPVRGFAVTLAVGIATSMFTAILVTRALVNLMYGGRKLESIKI